MYTLFYKTVFIVGFIVMFGTATAHAQTPEQQYRSTLLALIELLQEQIVTLQAQLQVGLVVPTSEPKSLLETLGATELDSYEVNDMKITVTAPDEYQAYLDRLAEIFPDQYDSYITELLVFTDPQSDVGAYVETSIPYSQAWTYAIAETEIQEDPYDEVSTELMIHEFAHVFSLDQVFAGQLYAETCHSYFADEACYGIDSYLGAFIDEFWNYQMLSELESIKEGSDATDAFYQQYESQFVSDYAASDPAEDFAESFTWYVLGRAAPRNSAADQKIEFFDQYRDIQRIADHIQSEL